MYVCVFRAWCIACSFHLNQHLLITHNLPVFPVGPGEKVVKTVIGQSHSDQGTDREDFLEEAPLVKSEACVQESVW